MRKFFKTVRDFLDSCDCALPKYQCIQCYGYLFTIESYDQVKKY